MLFASRFGLVLIWVLFSGCGSVARTQSELALPQHFDGSSDSQPQGRRTLDDGSSKQFFSISDLHVEFRIPPGWVVRSIASNYIEFSSGSDFAYMALLDYCSAVRWGLVYHERVRGRDMVCRVDFAGRSWPEESDDDVYQAYFDETANPPVIYLNWPDYDAILRFQAAMSLREGGECHPVNR